MIADLGQNIVVTVATPAISQPVSLQGPDNAVQGSVVIFVLGSLEDLVLQFQVSEDLENWSNPSTSSPWKQTITDTRGHVLLTKITGIGAPYVRVKLTTNISQAICALELNTSEQ